MNVPVDQHHRDRIRTSLDESLFIEAGAGTGKTRSLIDRLTELVASGVELRQVAAITFTEAAAAELKDRLRQEVEAQANIAPEGTLDYERWQRALHQLDGAAIQTLHAFAQRILAAHPLEAGLPPGFQTMDAVQSALAFDDRWQTFLDEFLGEDGPAELVETLVALDARFDELPTAALKLHENWDRLDRVPQHPGPRPELDIASIIEALETLVSYRGQCSKHDAFAEQLDEVPAVLNAVRAAPDTVALLRALALPTPHLRSGRAPNWPPGFLDNARETVREFRRARDEVVNSLVVWAAESLLIHLAQLARDYADERRIAGTLDFHDLLVLARDLLRKDEGVRRAMHERFSHVLIDEFQDTDPLQMEIASLIVREPACGADVPWQEAPVPPGSLVLVGDPKQSIYRFRRADIQLYLAAGTELRSTPVELVQNWRSVPSLLHWVNDVFARLIGREADAGSGQPAYVDLQPGRELADDQPHVHWFGVEYPTVGAAREDEAVAIAKAILKVRAEGWPIHVEDGEAVPARLEDIAILMPKRTILPYLERVFEQHAIPYRVESRSLLYEMQDVVDLVHILAALVDPTDEVSTVAALRSPAFACSDRDLFAWSKAGGRWNATLKRPADISGEHPVAKGMDWLAETHERAIREPVNSIVEAVIRERQLFEKAFAHRRPRERWQRYRFVLEQARAFACGQGATLRGFVAWMRRQAEEQADVIESAVPEPDDDAVRILTVHASKGLEFPVVVLAGLGSQHTKRTDAVLWDDDGDPQLQLGEVKTRGYQAAKTIDQQRSDAEQQRVLYVGATRARDHLLVSLYRGTGESHANRLAEFVDDNAHLWRELRLDDDVAETFAATSGVVAPGEDRATWAARRVATIDARANGPAVAATTIARKLRAEPGANDLARERMDETQPWKRGRAGTNIGRAVHAVLQTIDLETHEGLVDAAHAQAIAEGVSGRQGEIEKLVRAALASGAVREAMKSGRYWRELFVSTPIGSRIVEGFVDLLYERDGELVVVDYKTDALRGDEAVDQAAERYRHQAAAYALAVERQTGRRVVECRFVFVNQGGAAECDVPDLRSTIQEIEAWLLTGERNEATS